MKRLVLLLLSSLICACSQTVNVRPNPSQNTDDSGSDDTGVINETGEDTDPTHPIGPSEDAIPLRVLNPTSLDRADEPVTFGVPIDQARALMNVDSLCVIDPEGVPIPTDLRVLSRWAAPRSDESAAIKWVGVSFPATVSAKTVGHQSESQYYLDEGERDCGGEVQWSQTAEVIEVETSPESRFVIRRTDFTVFEEVVIDGGTVVDSPGRLLLRDVFGGHIMAQDVETQMESHSTVRAVVKQTGRLFFGSEDWLEYTARWFFHTGQNDVELEFRLENPGAYGTFFGVPSKPQFFEALTLSLPVSDPTHVVTASGNYPQADGDYSLHQTFRYQAHASGTTWDFGQDVDSHFEWTAWKNNEIWSTGQRHLGSVGLRSAQGGFLVTVDRFWQRFDKELRVEDGTVQIGLYPDWAHGPAYNGKYGTPFTSDPVEGYGDTAHRLDGGRWAIDRILFQFDNDTEGPVVAEASERANHPLMGLPDPAWVTQSGGFIPPWVETKEWADPGAQRYEQQVQVLVDDSVASNQAGLGRIGRPEFIKRGGTYGHQMPYGWHSHGDTPWANGYSSNHYGLTGSTLMGLYRSGDYRFYDNGRDMLRHRMFDMNHSRDDGPWMPDAWRGAQSYEKGFYHGNYYFGAASHTWCGDLLTGYVITADESAYESATECAEFALRSAPGNWSGLWGSRIPGWSIYNLTESWWILGDDRYLNEAGAGIARFRQLEENPPTASSAPSGFTVPAKGGYVLNPGDYYFDSSGSYKHLTRVSPWMHAIFFVGASRYVLVSDDRQYDAFLARMRDWMRDEATVRGQGSRNSRKLPYVYYSWTPYAGSNLPYEDPSPTAMRKSLHHTWAMSWALSHSHLVFEGTALANSSDLEVANELFETASRFHQNSVGTTADLDDPSTYSPIGFRMLMYPGSESKIMSNIALFGMPHLAAQP